MIKLSESEIRQLLKVTKKAIGRKVLYAHCPKCGKNEFGISLEENNLFGCFRKNKCGWTGNAFTLLRFFGKSFGVDKKKFEGKTIESYLEEVKSFQFDILPEVMMPIGFRKLTDDPYLRSRGFQDEDFQNYDCGFTKTDRKFKNRSIVCFKDHGQKIGYIGRSLEPEILPKYRNSKSDFSKMLDGLFESDCSEATLVEGLFDRVNVRNCFSELGIESRSVCSFGAKISDYQLRLLQYNGITKINLFFDPDVHKIIKRSLNLIAHKFQEVNIITVNDLDKDAGNMSLLEIGEAYLNRKKIVNFVSELSMSQL